MVEFGASGQRYVTRLEIKKRRREISNSRDDVLKLP
jgi:hypothetical protein